jgi:hypothetical protein
MMMADTVASLPPRVAMLIQRAAVETPHVPVPVSDAELRKHHLRMLRHVAFYQGLDGVQAYKQKHPEAASLRVNIETIAYPPKPAGYDRLLVSIAERWLANPGAAAATNVADVEHLNDRLGTSFPPAKHFSEPVSTGRLKKLKELFASYGVPLDIAKADTMSKIKAVAKEARGRIAEDSRPFGSIGVIAGGHLIIMGRSYRIERNGARECIRPTIGERRRRLYLDELEWIAEWFAPEGKDALSSTMVHSIGELPYSPDGPENQGQLGDEISGLPCGEVPALSHRINALKPQAQPHSTAAPEDVDPLTL